MPHSKNELKSNHRSPKNESMTAALALVKEGISIRESAKLTNLAYATVRRYWVKGKQELQKNVINVVTPQQNHNNNILSRRKTNTHTKPIWNKIFSSEQEIQLAEMCRGATTLQCRKLIFQMAIENNIKINPKWHIEQLAGRDWLANFQRRHRAILAAHNDNDIEQNNDNDNLNLNININQSKYSDNNDKPNDIKETTYMDVPIKTELIENNQKLIPDTIWSNGNFNNDNDNDNNEHCNNLKEKNNLCRNFLDDDISVKIHAPLPALNPLEILTINNNDETTNGCSSNDKTNFENFSNDNINIRKDFQNGLLNVLNHIAGIASKDKEKDSDEMFLMSLLPAMKKVKEEDKLKVRIELIKVLDHF